jgi:hypothetical protein
MLDKQNKICYAGYQHKPKRVLEFHSPKSKRAKALLQMTVLKKYKNRRKKTPPKWGIKRAVSRPCIML